MAHTHIHRHTHTHAYTYTYTDTQTQTQSHTHLLGLIGVGEGKHNRIGGHLVGFHTLLLLHVLVHGIYLMDEVHSGLRKSSRGSQARLSKRRSLLEPMQRAHIHG